MKSKKEKAFAILEALEQADESLVRQALDVDSPEKFRALGNVRLVRNAKSPYRKWGAIAACLALVLVLAAFPWLLSKLPTYTHPTEPTEPPLPPTTGFTESYDPSQPPKLLVYNGSTSLWPVITGYEWYCDQNFENIIDISSPWNNPLSSQLQESVPWLTAKESTLHLEFQVPRDSIHVRCWPADKIGQVDAYEDYETITVINRTITLKPGRYIYEVTAQWYPSYDGSGTVTYVFGAECAYTIVEPDRELQILCGDMALSNIVGDLDTGMRYDDVARKWVEVIGNGAWWTMRDSVLNGTPLPTMTLTGPLQIKLGPNGTLNNILVYYKHTENSPGLYMTTQDPSQLSTLPVGKWHILLQVTWLGRYIESEPECETYHYEYVFILDIPEPATPAYLWDFDENTGTLTVGGCEAIPDYSDQDYLIMRPWSQHWLDIQHIRVADGVKRIGNFAFRDLPNLQDVSLPDGLREIGDHAFEGAQNLSSISLPQSLEVIGDYAFGECRQLPAFDLPEGLKHIGIGTFTRCEIPTSLVIPASVETIGQSAFFNCVGLVDVTILGSPDELTLVFAGCSALRIVRFCGDAPLSLWDLTYEKGVICYYPAQNPTWTEEVLETANLDCTAWFASDDPASEQIVDGALSGQCGRTAYWELRDGVLTISGTGDVTYLGWDLLREQIQKVIIEDGITNITDSSFYQCGNLTTVTIPDTVTYIGFRAFYECVKLKAVTLPQNLTFLGDYAFWHCESIEKVVIPEGLTAIPRGAFLGCVSLKTVQFPSGLTVVGNAAFQRCTSLKELHFPASLTSLGDYAFSGCTGLKKLYFYGDVPGVSNFTFEGVSATAYYPAGNLSWQDGGMKFHSGNITEKPDPNQENQGCITHDFGDWVVLQEPTRLEGGKKERICNACGYTETEGLPPIVWEGEQPTHPELGEPIATGTQHNVKWALYADGTLTIFGVRIMESSFNYAWQAYADQITRIIIEDGLANIANNAFEGLTNLEEVTLPNTMMQIGVAVFWGCTKLESILLPASVVEIGNYAFVHCSSLQTVYFLGDAPDMAGNIFSEDHLTAYYPAGNDTWTEDVLVGYGGTVTWVAADPDTSGTLQVRKKESYEV